MAIVRQSILPILSILVLFMAQAVAQEWRGSVITDPAISSRCKKLVNKRHKKILHKQKLIALIKRNKKLQRVTPGNKGSLRKNLKDNLASLDRELTLSKIKIQHYTEDVIRKGCPGVTL